MLLYSFVTFKLVTSLNTRGTTAADLSQEIGVCFLSSIELAMVVEYKISS